VKGEGSIDISHGQCEPLPLLLLLLSGVVVAAADSCRGNC